LAQRSFHIFTATAHEAAAIRAVVPQEARLTVIGVGARNLPKELRADFLILAGFAGGLDPTLGVGDGVLEAGADVILPSGCRRGRFLCVDHILATPNEKRSSFTNTGATAVEMESAKVRALAERSGACFIHLRTISDTAGQALNPAMLRFLDDRGRVKPAALAKELAFQPTLIPELLRMGRAARVSGRQLRESLKQLLESLAVK
jgi:nucleoside phosphorylase